MILKKLHLINYPIIIWTSFEIACFPDFVKFIIHNMTYLPYSRLDKKSLTDIFFNNIFFEIQKSNICNFADNETLRHCSQDETVIENLAYDVKNLVQT